MPHVDNLLASRIGLTSVKKRQALWPAHCMLTDCMLKDTSRSFCLSGEGWSLLMYCYQLRMITKYDSEASKTELEA